MSAANSILEIGKFCIHELTAAVTTRIRRARDNYLFVLESK